MRVDRRLTHLLSTPTTSTSSANNRAYQETIMSSSGLPSGGRVHISDALRLNAQGALKVAAGLLAVAANATQNVPYLGIISGALAEFARIQNEVDMFQAEWKSVAVIAHQIKAIVDGVREQCERAGTDASTLPDALAEPFFELERRIGRTLDTVYACKSEPRRFRERARMYLNRGELLGAVKECRSEMQAALDMFNTKLNIAHAFALDELLKKDFMSIPRNGIDGIGIVQLPPPPAIFHGRAQEVDHVVDLVLHKRPARVAILGSGGIGKTSIALAVIHHPEVAELYAAQRFFLSCEAITTAEGIAQELLNLFGVAHDSKSGISSQDLVLSRMRTFPDALLCLDNLETPWDADGQAVESLLAQIASLSRISLTITSRGADRPGQIAWTRPSLPQIVPISFKAACCTWEAICDTCDEHAERLIHAVDCVPLAVTLLARLAQSDSAEALWARWEAEQTTLLRTRGPDHRLSNIDVSIQLSLCSPRMRESGGAVGFFSVLCTLPQGMPMARIPAFVDAFAELVPNMRSAITLLKQSSLAYSSADGYLRVLSPIRLHMQAHCPISDTHFACLAQMYRNLVEFEDDEFDIALAYAKDHIQPELGNITTILRMSLTRDGNHMQQTLDAVHLFSELCFHMSVYDDSLLSDSMSICQGNDWPESEGKLWESTGFCMLLTSRYPEALAAFSKGIELHHRCGDQKSEAHCLKDLGQVYQLIDQLDRAEYYQKSAAALYQKIGYQRGQISSQIALGYVYVRAQRLDEARSLLQSTLQLCDETGDRVRKAHCLHTLGELLFALSELDKAEGMLRSAVALQREIENRPGEINSLNLLGYVLRHLQRHDEARTVLRAAYPLAVDIGDILGQGHALYYLGLSHEECHEYDEAEMCLEKALELYEQVKQPSSIEVSRQHLYSVRHLREHTEHDRQDAPLREQDRPLPTCSSRSVNWDEMDMSGSGEDDDGEGWHSATGLEETSESVPEVGAVQA